MSRGRNSIELKAKTFLEFPEVPGFEVVNKEEWLPAIGKAFGYKFGGLDEAALSSLLCINCPDRPNPLPPVVRPKIIELYAYVDI